MPTLLSLAAPQVVMMTTCGAASDNKVGIMKILILQFVRSKGNLHSNFINP